MKQLNVNVTPQMERDLRLYMKRRKITRKSDAIRQALHEAADRSGPRGGFDFRQLLGMGLRATLNPNPRFKSTDDLW